MAEIELAWLGGSDITCRPDSGRVFTVGHKKAGAATRSADPEPAASGGRKL